MRMQLPDRVILSSSLDNISPVAIVASSSGNSSSPPPPYQGQVHPSDSDGELPHYKNFSLNAAKIIIDSGYDLIDIYELTNQALGGVVLTQISSSWLLTMLHFVMFLSILRPIIFSTSIFTGMYEPLIQQ